MNFDNPAVFDPPVDLQPDLGQIFPRGQKSRRKSRQTGNFF
jgi:hypothetical protein